MLEWWNQLSTLSQVFYCIAIPASVILVLQTLLLLFGAIGGDSDVDVHTDLDADTDLDGDGIPDTPGDVHFDAQEAVDHEAHMEGPEHAMGLRLFTMRTIVAFLTMAGWTGAALLDLGASPYLAVFLAFVAGFVALLLVAVLMRLFLKAQQSGNLDYNNAVGATGEVYLTIPQDAKGKVTLVFQERFCEVDAICPSGSLKTGTPVRVIAANERYLTVEPIVTPVSQELNSCRWPSASSLAGTFSPTEEQVQLHVHPTHPCDADAVDAAKEATQNTHES